MKTRTSLGLSAAAAIILAAACNEEPTYVGKKTFTVSDTQLTLTEGESRDIHYTAYPRQTPSWTLANDSILATEATDDTTLTVTALAAGQTDMTLECHDIRHTVSVTVRPFTIPVTGIRVTPGRASVHTGDTLRLRASVLPADATDTAYTWTSTDASVAAVDSTGLARTLRAGTCTLRATTRDGGRTAGCTLTVTDRTYAVDSVTLDRDWLELVTGDTCTLTATLWPSNATNRKVSWHSHDAGVASVSDRGLVRALETGVTTVTVTTADGNRKAVCTVTVTDGTTAVDSVTLDRDRLDMETGSTQTLTATIWPSDATDKKVSWHSQDASVAGVTDKGAVRALRAGATTVTVTTADGNRKASCTVTVTDPHIAVTGISLDRKEMTLERGSTGRLTATVTPSDATDRTVIWTSSDGSVATVGDGLVSALKAGSATITATTRDGGRKASCRVTVTVTPAAITLDRETLALTQGETGQLTAVIKPDDASDRTVTWTSSDTEVATVDTSGTVTAQLGGEATVTARTANGLEASCTVTVTNLPDAVLSLALLDASGNECTGWTFNPTQVSRNTAVTARLTVRHDGRTQTCTAGSGITPEDMATFTWESEDTEATGALEVYGQGATATLSAYHDGKTRITCTASGKDGVQGSATAAMDVETKFLGRFVTSLTASRAAGSAERLAYKGKALTAAFTATAVYTDNTTEDVTARTTWTAYCEKGECSMSGPEAGTMTISSLGTFTEPSGKTHSDCAGGAFTAVATYGGLTAEAQVQAHPSFTAMQVYFSPEGLSFPTQEPVTFTVMCQTYGGKTCTGNTCNFGDNGEFLYETKCLNSSGTTDSGTDIDGQYAATGTISFTNAGRYTIRTAVTDRLTGETLTFDRKMEVR